MSIREGLQNKSAIVTGAALLVIVGAVVWTGYNLFSSKELSATNMLFFSVDDGKTWFTASADNIPPFTHDGKQAYQAFVWTTDGGKTQFVSHLLRYTPAGRARIMEQQKAGPAAPPGIGGPGVIETEIKRPGDPDTAWIRSSDPRAGEITLPKITAGQQLEAVHP